MGFLIAVAVAAGIFLVTPMHCQGVIAKPPFRGCRKIVVGLFGRCHYHGFQPGRRVILLLGGPRLPLRRVCDKCGQPRVFGRHQDSGRPFLGCAGFPACTRSIQLSR
jgi:hypothetical protein